LRTFSFFIHTTDSTVPALLFELLSDEGTVRSVAERALADSPECLLVEVREEDRLIFSIDRNGASWTRRESRTPGRPSRRRLGLIDSA
jgi:hypothetical protein